MLMDSPSFRLKLWASIKQRQTTVGHTTCRYCSVRSYALVRQPFLKWLFTLCSGLFVSQRGWRERKESALTSLWRGKSRPAIARWKFQIICSQGCSVFSQISNKPREFFEPLFFFGSLGFGSLGFGSSSSVSHNSASSSASSSSPSPSLPWKLAPTKPKHILI